MPTTQLLPLAVQSFRDNNGVSLVGGLLYTYAAGTATPQATYTDSTGVTPNANPIVLNARGEAQVWLTKGQAYKLVLQDAAANVIWTADQISSASTTADVAASAAAAAADLANTALAAKGSGLVGYNSSLTYLPATVGYELNYLLAGGPFLTLKHGSVRFVNAAPYATNVTLSPYNGNGLLVRNGAVWQMATIPAAGLTANITSCNLNGVAAQALAQATVYYAYVAFIGGVVQLDFSTTGHATDATTGVEVKATDATRTLVGMVYVGNGVGGTVAGSIAGTASNQLVTGWFNRIASDEYVTITGNTASVTYTELVATNRINFVMWPDDDPYCIATAVISNSGLGNITYVGVGVDSATVPSGTQGTNQAAANNYQASVTAIPITGALPEGFHYLSSMMRTSAGTGTVVQGQIHLYLRS